MFDTESNSCLAESVLIGGFELTLQWSKPPMDLALVLESSSYTTEDEVLTCYKFTLEG